MVKKRSSRSSSSTTTTTTVRRTTRNLPSPTSSVRLTKDIDLSASSVPIFPSQIVPLPSMNNQSTLWNQLILNYIPFKETIFRLSTLILLGYLLFSTITSLWINLLQDVIQYHQDHTISNERNTTTSVPSDTNNSFPTSATLSTFSSTPPSSIVIVQACQTVSLERILLSTIPKVLGGTGDIPTIVEQVLICVQSIRNHPTFDHQLLYILGSIYITLQMFAIPGPLILSIVAGALYGIVKGGIFIAVCATTGATACYILSWLVMKPLLIQWLPERLQNFQQTIESKKQSNVLFWYMLALRITPAAPNWFVNVASPIIGIPLPIFIFATLIGLIPANYFHTQVGVTIANVLQQQQQQQQPGEEGILDTMIQDDNGTSSTNTSSTTTNIHNVLQHSWQPLITLLLLQGLALLPPYMEHYWKNTDVLSVENGKKEDSTKNDKVTRTNAGGRSIQNEVDSTRESNNPSRSRKSKSLSKKIS